MSDEMRFDDALGECMEIANKLLDFPLHGVQRSKIFSVDGIRLFQDLANQMQSNRRKKNWGVLGGSLTSIVGGGMAIAGAALIPFTFGGSTALLIAGAGVGVVGTSISVGFTLEKFFADKEKKKLAQPILEKFLYFQKNIATAIAAIHTTVEVIHDQKKSRITLQDGVSLEVQQKLSELWEKLAKLQEDSKKSQIHEIIHEISSIASTLNTDVLKTILQPVKQSLRVDETWYEVKIKRAKEKPFEILICAIEELRTQRRNNDKTFFGLIQKLFQKELPEERKDKITLPAGVCLEGAGNALVKGGMVAARVAVRAADVGQDTARTAVNVLRVAQVASIAGIVLNAAGIVIDVGFLGMAAYDLKKKDKEQYAQALEDIALVMVELNDLSEQG